MPTNALFWPHGTIRRPASLRTSAVAVVEDVLCSHRRYLPRMRDVDYFCVRLNARVGPRTFPAGPRDQSFASATPAPTRARRSAASNRSFSLSQRASSACDLFSRASTSAWMAAAFFACSRSALSNAACALSMACCRRSRSFCLAASSLARSRSRRFCSRS